eukprot:scaffold1878_cov104-Cylindrotheca_fusiformis.AAC.1
MRPKMFGSTMTKTRFQGQCDVLRLLSVLQEFQMRHSGHRQLKVVTLPSSIQEIGKSAFQCCRKLNSILYQALGDLLANLVLSEGLEQSGEY